ncbi:MerR family transcriptional regulator [Cohnella nanjingensis]|uniref:MerR family transcriptional regulator n=1 Tax=Cohnella nanjingensis TaxID=1387779 RepID=A0A7X0RLX0_9BACL|nr:MerR family transcriptional regulator [Cohnella nanjingensis]MBB6669875.1 MerR family transcriptional regulator [Cohnella nanjingensis]
MIISGQTQWKVGELAKLTGLTVRTLRFYDQIGLLSPTGYSDGGYRLYEEPDLSRLQQVLALKELGLQLDEIKSVLADPHYNPLEVVNLQVARLRDQIARQQQLLKELQNAASLMQANEPLNVEGFAKLLGMMKKSHESYFSERRTSMERYFDRLGDWLAQPSEANIHEEDDR